MELGNDPRTSGDRGPTGSMKPRPSAAVGRAVWSHTLIQPFGKEKVLVHTRNILSTTRVLWEPNQVVEVFGFWSQMKSCQVSEEP